MADVEQRDVSFETLTWWFPETRMTGTTLAMQWGNSYVPLDIAVESSIDLIVSAETAAPILGSYEMSGEGERPWWNRRVEVIYDSSKTWIMSSWYEREADETESDAESADGEDGDADQRETEDDADAEDDDDEDDTWYAALFPVTEEWFTPGWLEDGELWSATKAMTLEFEYQNGRATGYQLRNKKDEVVATAKRIE